MQEQEPKQQVPEAQLAHEQQAEPVEGAVAPIVEVEPVEEVTSVAKDKRVQAHEPGSGSAVPLGGYGAAGHRGGHSTQGRFGNRGTGH